jgi:RNA polymerase sigma-70 factor, ECF subfamily
MESLLMDELELLRAAGSHANAFAELYRLHVTRVYRYHMAHVGIAKDAEDLTSQTFMTVVEEFSSFHGGSFAAWLMGIAAKKRLHDIRGTRRELPIDAVLYYQTSGLPTDRAGMQRREMEGTTRSLKQISPDHAEAIILSFFGALSDSEVGRVLKKSTATTRMLIVRGIQELITHSTLNEESLKDQMTFDSNTEHELLVKKLTNIANQITPEPHFISELEKTLAANHVPRTKWAFSMRQIASLAGWALLVAAGVFLLYWTLTPTSASINPLIANTGNTTSTAKTEPGFSRATSGPSPASRATTTRLPTLEYIVQAGDNCTYIADQFGVTINQLITLNDLNDSCDIWIDQVLVIPIVPTPTPPN